VERDELGDLGFGGRVVVFLALFDAEAFEEFADWRRAVSYKVV
jgi:hypothetical protein